jgi:hypothetical protein
MLFPSCLCICVSPLSTFEYLNQSLRNLVCISWQLSPSQLLTSKIPPITLCVYMCSPPIIARQRLCKHVPATTNTRSNRKIVGRIIFYAIRVLSTESLWVCLCIPLLLIGNNSVKTSSHQRRIVRGVVFYAARVASKDSRRLVLPRTSCF